MNRALAFRRIATVILLLAVPGSASARQFQAERVSGVVRDFESGATLAGVTVSVQGSDTQVSTDASGRFVLRDVPAGTWTLEVEFEGYGARTYAMEIEPGGFAEVEINLTAEPEAAPMPPPSSDPARTLGQVVEAEEIARLIGSVRSLGELIQRAAPGLRSREAAGFVGFGLCLEFRGSSARSGTSLVVGGDEEDFSCLHPRIFLDGIQAQDPTSIYDLSALADIRRIQVIPSAEAGARFGSAPNGVVLIETRFMVARPAPVDVGVGNPVPGAGQPFVSRARSSFDWDQDPAGHPFARTFVGAVIGNAIGLTAGVSVGRQCVFIEDRTLDIAFSCGNAGVAGVSAAAIALPALGSAMGAHFGGRTQLSTGKLVPAMVGAAMGVLPGYIFSLSTVGEGVQTMNTIGKVFLVVGTPLLTSLADRMFRGMR
ncbi:MAG: carboxypeptidase-like regulatory domain-containing protein [Gemmatimonadetes bacterium]|nr:carboxypeptidase-like regulatory domain-containing protein [Gemmatimonadota bacterium]